MNLLAQLPGRAHFRLLDESQLIVFTSAPELGALLPSFLACATLVVKIGAKSGLCNDGPMA